MMKLNSYYHKGSLKQIKQRQEKIGRKQLHMLMKLACHFHLTHACYVLIIFQEYGSGKTEIQAKVWYLTSVKHYPLYGSTMFHVQYKGFWSYPNNLILAVDVQGIKFVNQKTKHVSLVRFVILYLKVYSPDHG